MLDSAALFLALSPQSAPLVPARLCLRAGYICFTASARAMGFPVDENPIRAAGISLSYEEFLDGVARLREVGFPVERDPADAWPDFVGWRANYERAAYELAFAVDAVPARWSGPRRHHPAAIPPLPSGPGASLRYVGGPTDDKPSVTLEAPRDPDRVSSFLNVRVKDIHAVSRVERMGAQFLTTPKGRSPCRFRAPDRGAG